MKSQHHGLMAFVIASMILPNCTSDHNAESDRRKTQEIAAQKQFTQAYSKGDYESALAGFDTCLQIVEWAPWNEPPVHSELRDIAAVALIQRARCYKMLGRNNEGIGSYLDALITQDAHLSKARMFFLAGELAFANRHEEGSKWTSWIDAVLLLGTASWYGSLNPDEAAQAPDCDSLLSILFLEHPHNKSKSVESSRQDVDRLASALRAFRSDTLGLTLYDHIGITSSRIDNALLTPIVFARDSLFIGYFIGGAIDDQYWPLIPTEAVLVYLSALAKEAMGDYRGAINDYSVALSNVSQGIDNQWLFIRRGVLNMAVGNKHEGCLDLSRAGERGNLQAYHLIRKCCR